jgi:predicted hydrolase (HD superfamily)
VAIGRLDLYIVLRNQLADKALSRRALAVEAVMEALARAAGHDPAMWGLAGLGADIDVKLAAQNPERRGVIAEELLLAEGVPAEAAAAARRWRADPGRPGELPPIVQGLVAAQRLVGLVEREVSEPEVTLATLEPVVLDHRLRRLVRREEPEALRAAACLDALGIERPAAAELALAALRRVNQDLDW